MAVYSLTDLILGIATTLSAAPSLVQTQYAGSLAVATRMTEGMADAPTLQIYPETDEADWTGETDRVTLSGKHSIKEYTIHADLLARQRSNIAEDMAVLLTSINDIENILDTQTYQNVPGGVGLFGRIYITSYRWSWHRVVFGYAGADYVGARFVLVVRCGTEI